MTIEDLNKRANELQETITNAINQLHVLHGHKNEIDYQIKLATEAAEALAKQDESNVE